ncbi:MAG: lytic transglycosylase domain-containing protein [Ramlibacter sp.]|nr:lytic transglycosylase domain-containing protein [Ramlibacter sp.]
MKLRTILALFAVTLSWQAPAQSRDEIILEMSQAFRQGNRARLTQLLPAARGHALEPWAAYWELRARLDVASPQEVQDFMSRYAGSYQEDRMRNDWLLVLGQRRDWTTFATEHPRYRMNDDREVRCYGLLTQHLRDGTSAPANLADEVRRNWFAQREADDGCTLAARTLMADGHGSRSLSLNDAWRKARLSIEANRPRAAAAAVEIAAPKSMNLLNDMNNSPSKFLTSSVLAISKSRRELITLALVKLATTDIEGAAVLLEGKWAPQLSAEERNWVWGVIGRQSAGKLRPDALEYFAKVTRDSDLSDEMLAWKTRAALRSTAGPQWPLVLQAVNAMSDEARKDPTWVYWKARALLGLGNSEAQRAEAQRLLESIASVRGFYEQLALEELGQKIVVPQRPAPLSDQEKEAARQNLSLQRGIYAILLGLRADGVREWNYATNLAKPGGMTDRELLAAAQLACDRELWDRCINTSERTRTEIDLEQRFPMPFRESVTRRAREINLDPAYVYGLIRQESRFIMDARSHVGASGLMQVMPATARWTARKIGISDFKDDQINNRETNIAIGTGYLKLVLEDFSGSMPMAAAAYNAGPGRPRAWRNGPVMEAAAWAENVPFNETRDYVKKVLSNTTAYAAILTGQPQSLKARLGKVGPREASQPEPNRDIP